MLLHVSIASPLPGDTWVAEVELAGGGRERIRIDNGWFEGEVAGAPRRLTCLLASPDGARASSVRAPETLPTIARRPVDVMELFGPGVDVPETGRLDVQLLWLAPCDGTPELLPEGKRFGSYEHTLCAGLVGKAAGGAVLRLEGIDAHFDAGWELDVGGKALSFGTIIAMAGDYYAHLDDRAVTEFGWAWPAMTGLSGWLAGDYRAITLAGDSPSRVAGLREHIQREATGGQLGLLATALEVAESKFALRRYLALASQNICHFACQHGAYSETGNPALALYRAYHRRAQAEASAAGEAGNRDRLDAALVADAFGCHFLTDLFASGHVRVPRDVLGRRFGIIAGALVMAKRGHDEDNHKGLWVTTLARSPDRRVVWRAFGDETLQIEDAKLHLAAIQESVRRSAAEVFAAYCAARQGTSAPVMPRADDLVPIPLAPGEQPDETTDVVLELATEAERPGLHDFPANHPAMYAILADGQVGQRTSDGYLALEFSAPEPARSPGIEVP